MISFLLLNKNGNYIFNYFEVIKNNNINYSLSLLNIVYYNFKYNIIMWLCGLVFIFSFIIPLVIAYKGISLGYTFLYLLYIFKIKGILIALIMLFPCLIINCFVSILIAFYSANFAFKTYNIFTKEKLVNLKTYIKNYVLQLIILLMVLLLSSLFETYITSNILKYVL